MKYLKLSSYLFCSLLLASCGAVNMHNKPVYKENLENLQLNMTTDQVVAKIGQSPTQVLNYPKYTVFEYRARFRYNDDVNTSEISNLFKSGFNQKQNYSYVVNFFGVPPENDQTIWLLIKDPSLPRIIHYRIYDSAKPIYRLFGSESADYRLYLGKLKIARPLASIHSDAVNACLIFEKNRLKGIFAAYVPTQGRTQHCAISLNLRNEYFD